MTDRLRVLRHVIALIWRTDPWRAGVTVLLTVLEYAAPAAMAVGVRQIVDGIATGQIASVKAGAVLLFVTVGAQQGAGFAAFAVSVGLRERVGHQLDLEIASVVARRAGIEHFEDPDQLDRLQLLREGAAGLARLQDVLVQVVGIASRLVISLLLLAAVEPRLLVLVVFAAPSVLASTAVDRITDRRDSARAGPQRRAATLDWYVRSPGPAKELRTFGSGAAVLRHIEADRAQADGIIRRSNVRIACLESLGALAFACGFLTAVLLVLGGAARGQVTVGDLALVIVVAGQLNGQLGAATSWLTELLEMLRTAQRLALLGPGPRTAALREPPPPPAEIVLDDVWFRYPGSGDDDYALRGIDLTIPVGCSVAIVGENGSGKSTLVKLLVGLHGSTRGRILVGDVNVTDLDPAKWRAELSGAFQDTPPLEFRVREVVGLGQVAAIDDDETIRTALQTVRSCEFAARLPADLDTPLGRTFGDAGVQLSGGQWQGLALARANMRRAPRLLLLDEPTANLDPRAEDELYESYLEAMGDPGARDTQSTVLVSHRFATVRAATLIVVLHQGRIIERGSHATLMAEGGVYAELFRLQAGGYR